MSDANPWAAAEIAATLTTYIVGIETALHGPMTHAVAHLIVQVDEPFATLQPIMARVLADIDVTLPWEDDDA